jgi:hypothetical protein
MYAWSNQTKITNFVETIARKGPCKKPKAEKLVVAADHLAASLKACILSFLTVIALDKSYTVVQRRDRAVRYQNLVSNV